jgi:hypothetical protein
MVSLYYLVDQAGDISGEKALEGSYLDLAHAQEQATSDGVAHYSIEDSTNGITTIVFIC